VVSWIKALGPGIVLVSALASLSQSALAGGVSAYLPLNLEPEMERQIERVLILADEPILKRPFAVQLVLDALPQACKVDKPLCTKVKRYLQRYSREYHDAIRTFLSRVSDARLEEPVTIQWFKDPPLTITVTEALTQCAMHSHYHRGQNATRLRELGGVPPMTDLIVWYWKGRPQPSWTT